MKTYKSILDTMQNAYFEKTGDIVDWHSDLGARLQTVASELLSLYAYSDFVLRQAMIPTAAGEYLDNHAALRGIVRKTASKAVGALTFYLAEPQETAVPIPVGTVCSMKDKPFVQFITTQEGLLAAGETAVTVSAEATRAGADGNAPAATVTVMVNPPSEIFGVTNAAAFQGGYDAESDTALRQRILNAYKICQTGFSPDSVREQLLQLDELADCRVQFSDNTFQVCVKPKAGQITPALEAAVSRRLAVTHITDCSVVLTNCRIKPFRLAVNLHLRYTDSAAKEEAEARIRELCSALSIGEPLMLSQVTYALTDMDSLAYCEAASSEATDGAVYCGSDEALALEGIEVNLYE